VGRFRAPLKKKRPKRASAEAPLCLLPAARATARKKRHTANPHGQRPPGSGAPTQRGRTAPADSAQEGDGRTFHRKAPHPAKGPRHLLLIVQPKPRISVGQTKRLTLAACLLNSWPFSASTHRQRNKNTTDSPPSIPKTKGAIPVRPWNNSIFEKAAGPFTPSRSAGRTCGLN